MLAWRTALLAARGGECTSVAPCFIVHASGEVLGLCPCLFLTADHACNARASCHSYAIMRSGTPRFRRSSASETAHLGPGYVDPDHTKLRPRPQSARVGRSPRFGSELNAYGADVQYNTDQGAKASVATKVGALPRPRYARPSMCGAIADAVPPPLHTQPLRATGGKVHTTVLGYG